MDLAKLRMKLEATGIKSEDIDEVLSAAGVPEPVEEGPDILSKIEALRLTLEAAPDWQSRAKIAAEIIKLELEM